MKKRHKWNGFKKTNNTEIQKCVKCKLYRFKALGIWMYSKDKPIKEDMFPNIIGNNGCIY